MGFMGYEATRVEALASAADAAVARMRAIRSDDPAVRPSIAPLRDAQRLLEDTWLPLLRRVLSCTAMSTGFTPVRLDGSDVRTAELVELQAHGWRVVTDPAGSVGTGDALGMTTAAARALGLALSSDRISQLLDTPEELAWLRAQLDVILTHPRLAAAFTAELDDVWVLAVLADERLLATQGSERDATRMATLDALVVACTTVAALGAERDAWIATTLDQLDPFAAALVVRALGLEGEQLADACVRILTRWRTPPSGTDGWPDSTGPTFTADLLLPMLVADPAAATAFLAGAGRHPDIVFRSTDDGDLVRQLLLIGTDPARASATDVGAFLVPALTWLEPEVLWVHADSIGGGFDARDLLGEVVAPWLLYFGARVDRWGWTYDEGNDALRFVVDHPRALDDLVAAMAVWREELRAHPLVDAAGRIDGRWATELATMFDQLERAVDAEHVEDAAFRRMWLDFAIDLATTTAASLVKSVSGAVGLDAVLSRVVARLQQALTQIGWLPPDADLAGEVAQAERVDRKLDTAVLAVVALTTQLIAAGAVPRDALDSLDLGSAREDRDARAVRDALADMIERARDRSTPAAYNALVAMLAMFLPPSAVNEVS